MFFCYIGKFSKLKGLIFLYQKNLLPANVESVNHRSYILYLCTRYTSSTTGSFWIAPTFSMPTFVVSASTPN